jgi:catechol 2,3-dioxygenase-like lactoylglutathione lyase family enzyme
MKITLSSVIVENQTKALHFYTEILGFKFGTGEARVSVWRDLVSEAEKLSQGSLIRIENCNVRAPFEGLMQISSGMFTRIVVEEQ